MRREGQAVAAVIWVSVLLAGCAQPERRRTATMRGATLVAIPAAETQVGDDQAAADERPAFRTRVAAFLMDRTPVTVAQFAAFVRETGYVTDAEGEDGGQVLDKRDGGWVVLKGADWRTPEGPLAPAAVADHPVTQVSYRDADAFCHAYGARLPTEVEWERAARMGQTADGHVFKAGDDVERDGRWRANVWQGLFPLLDEGRDGYKTTSPVGAFGAAPSGLTDMAGNVWEWTASWYIPYGATPSADNAVERVQRGGSYLCDPGFCQGFRVTARGHATPQTALVHVGFRCAADGDRPPPRAGRLVAPGAVRADLVTPPPHRRTTA